MDATGPGWKAASSGDRDDDVPVWPGDTGPRRAAQAPESDADWDADPALIPGSTVLGRVAAGMDLGRLRAAFWPTVCATMAASLAGGALAGRLYLPGVATMAAVGPAAALAAPAVIVAAILLLYRQVTHAAAASAPRWQVLAARGANPTQLIVLAAGPRSLLALLCGVIVPLVVAPLLALFPVHAVGRGFSELLLPALVWSLVTAGLLVVTTVWAAWPTVLLGEAGAHFRQAPSWRRPLWMRWYLDVALLVVSAAVGRAGAIEAQGAAASAAAAALNGPAFGGGGLPPVSVPPAHFVLAPLMYVAPAAFVLGGALLAARLVGLAAGWWDRRAPSLGSALVLWLRGLARGRGWTYLLVPAVAASAVVFALSGGPTVAVTAAAQQEMQAGADLSLEETWPAPCAGACTTQILQALPVPDIAGTNRGLPGVTAVTAVVPAQDQITTGSNGTTPATLLGIEPDSFAATVRWPAGFAGTGGSVLAELRAHPGGAVISTALAQLTGLHPGQEMQSQLLGDVRVVGVAPAWPGVPAAASPWALVNWSLLNGALTQHGAYTGAGFSAYVLMRLRASARTGPLVAALRAQGLTVSGLTRGVGFSGPSVLARVLWPLGALAAVLVLLALALPWADPQSLPSRDAEFALSAVAPVERLKAVAPLALAGLGLAWGALAGWGAALLFWPDLQVATGAVSGPIVTAPLGAWVALCVLAFTAWRLARHWPALVADISVPAVVERLAAAATSAAAAAMAPEAVVGPVAPTVAAKRPAAQPGGWLVPVRAVRAVMGLAARRLRASPLRMVGLAFGLLLAASVAATVPLYTAGSLTRVLHAGLQPHDDRPAGAVLVRWLPPSQLGMSGQSTLSPKDAARLAAVTASVGRVVGLPTTGFFSYAATQDEQVITAAEQRNPYATGVYFGGSSIDTINGLPSHVRIVRGHVYHVTASGPIEAMVTQNAFTTDNLRLGQVYLYPEPNATSYVRLRLVGVFEEVDPTGPNWPYRYFTSDFFIEPTQFAHLEASGSVTLGNAAWYTTLRLGKLTAVQVPRVAAGVQQVALTASGIVPGADMDLSPYNQLEAFVQREQTLTSLLRLVSVPILAIALYFVAITAGLIVAADSAEISVFASRGAGVRQILSLYLMEWLLLALPVAALGPLPAAFFARAVGASQGFLHFSATGPLPVFIRPIDFLYSGVAAALGVVAAMVPVLVGVGRSIVGARLRASRTIEQPLWQRAYLDGIALVLLAVIWWDFHRATVSGGGGAAALVSDPALFVLPPIFLLVAGLLVVRFLGWLLRSLDAAIGPFASPALSLPLRRIGRLPAQFAPVLLLLCFTAALGSYSAASARTLDQNLSAAANYRVGAQVQLQEVSPCSLMKPEVGVCITYDDVPLGSQGVRPMPPFALHRGIPGLSQAAELVEEQVTVQGQSASAQADLALINPAQYAQVAWWMKGLDPRSLGYYVDQLVSQPDAALVDPTMARQLGLQVGQTFSLSDGVYNGTFTDVGTVLRWSGTDANAPLIVANLAYAKTSMGLIPAYRTALLRLAPHASLRAVLGALADRGIFAESTAVASSERAQALSTPEWAGQTGMLTVGFLTALGITILGYLLYAAVLLRGQLSQLGLLFALGLPWGSVLSTVALEQGTLLVSGAAGGAVAGLVAAALFLPLFRPAFTGPNSPPFLALGPGAALGQVGLVLALLLAVALGGLLLSLRRMHVGETIKLEE